MTEAEKMADFVFRAAYEELSGDARVQLKLRVLDALGCAIGALDQEPMLAIQAQIEEFGGPGLATTIGGGRNAPDRAAFYNSALVRYLDFNDSYLAPNETCHPSDNLGAVLAASEYASRSGRDFLTALAVAYQVQCRLSDEAPVRAQGFDHTTQGSYALAAGISKALGMEPHHIAHAIAICGTAFNALRVTRTGTLSNWKGLAYANTAYGCMHGAFLAARGITGPLEVFEGNKGFMETISGPFQIDWHHEDLERVTRTIVKRYNAEIHSQSVIEGILDLKQQHGFAGQQIERIEIEIFDVAYNIIGGGEEGDKTRVQTKEAADHSLPYLVAVAILDGQVMPEQYTQERIRRADVQRLIRRIHVRPTPELSERFPAELPCKLIVHLQDGQTFSMEKHDYEGFVNRPAHWDTVARKFQYLSEAHTTPALRDQILAAVADLDKISIRHLTGLLQQTGAPADLGGKEEVPHYGGT